MKEEQQETMPSMGETMTSMGYILDELEKSYFEFRKKGCSEQIAMTSARRNIMIILYIAFEEENKKKVS